MKCDDDSQNTGMLKQRYTRWDRSHILPPDRSSKQVFAGRDRHRVRRLALKTCKTRIVPDDMRRSSAKIELSTQCLFRGQGFQTLWIAECGKDRLCKRRDRLIFILRLSLSQ